MAGIISRNLDKIRNNPLFDFLIPVSKSTGEIKTEKHPVAEYKGIKLIDYGNVIRVSLSIHSYFNNGAHNYNDFNATQLFNTIKDLCQLLRIKAEEIRLVNLEIGVNIITEKPPKTILQSVIIHRGKKFTEQVSENKNFKECGHSQYYIKIYDKGLQNNLTTFILRCEVKFIKMEKINKMRIVTLLDLCDLDKLRLLSKEILRIINEILFGHLDADVSRLSMSDKMLFHQGNNPCYWENLIPDSGSFPNGSNDTIYKKQYKLYERKLARFKLLLINTGADSIRNQLIFSIESKLTELLGDNDKGETDHLLYTVNSPHRYTDRKRECLVTGLDISMQKSESKFLCTTGLRFYKENHPAVWVELKKRLAANWSTAAEEIQIREIHHSIRNEYFNKVHNARRRISGICKYPSLFDQTPFICRNILTQAGFDTYDIVNNNKIQHYAFQ